MSASDGVLAPDACMLGNGLPQCQNAAPRSAERYLPDTASRTLPAPRRRRNAGSALATEPRSVHPRATESDGMPDGRSRGPACGPAASGWLVVHPASAAPPDACWHATLLPTPGVDAPPPLSGARLPSVAVRSASA